MTAIATSADIPQQRGQPVSRSRQQAAVSLWSCLLVSTEQQLRRRMREAASEAGWNPVECKTVEESLRQAALHVFPLALIDVGHQLPSKVHEDLIRSLRQSASNLVVVCDQDANPEGELWARQRGAWMYLPEVNDASDLARICREAQAVTEKLRGPAKAAPVGS